MKVATLVVNHLRTYVVTCRPAGLLAQRLDRKLSSAPSSIVTCLSLCLRECSECLLVLVMVTVNQIRLQFIFLNFVLV